MNDHCFVGRYLTYFEKICRLDFFSPCKQVEDEENEQDENDESGGEENLRL